MDTAPAIPPGPRTGRRHIAGPRLIRRLAGLLLWVGVVGAIAGVAYDINGATRAQGDVAVLVQAPGGLRTAEFDGNRLAVPDDVFRLSAWDSTVAEHLLNRGHFAVLGLCLLAGAILLRPLLISINDGRPFQRGNAARIAGVAGLVALNGVAGLLPLIAGELVLDRIGLGDAGSAITAAPFSPPSGSLLVAALLLVLAEVFRRGTDLEHEIEGLV